jgi:hypothetical protein
MPALNDLFPFLGMVVPFLFVIVIIGMKNAEKMRRDKMRYDVIRLAIEKGQPIPPELATDVGASRTEPSRDRADNDKRAGLICIAVGIGVFLLLHNLPGTRDVKWAGTIPAFIGVALLISGFLSEPKPGAAPESSTTPTDIEKR